MTLTQQIEKLENRLVELKAIDRSEMTRDQLLIHLGQREEVKKQLEELKTERENKFWEIPSGTKSTDL